jgi:hypothetical protein
VRSLHRRLQKLEGQLTDGTGLVPHSDAWFAFWEDKLARDMDGEDVDKRGFTLAVVDRIVEAVNREADRNRSCGETR